MRSQNGTQSQVARKFARDSLVSAQLRNLKLRDDSKAQRVSLLPSRLSAARNLFTRSVNWLSGCITQAVSQDIVSAQRIPAMCAVQTIARRSNTGDLSE